MKDAWLVADFLGYQAVVPEGIRMLRAGGCYLEVGGIAPGNIFSYDATALVRDAARLDAAAGRGRPRVPRRRGRGLNPDGTDGDPRELSKAEDGSETRDHAHRPAPL